MKTELDFMQSALELARQASCHGEVPVGAVLVCQGVIIGRGFNQPIGLNDPTAHAEIQALRDAGRAINNYRLVDTILYVTLEPCAMCWGALVHARVGEVVYAASEPKAGVVSTQADWLKANWSNHRPVIRQGPMAQEAGQILSDFFARRREEKKFLKAAHKDGPPS
jgi:tRNA(adenine34) deaminase